MSLAGMQPESIQIYSISFSTVLKPSISTTASPQFFLDLQPHLLCYPILILSGYPKSPSSWTIPSCELLSYSKLFANKFKYIFFFETHRIYDYKSPCQLIKFTVNQIHIDDKLSCELHPHHIMLTTSTSHHY